MDHLPSESLTGQEDSATEDVSKGNGGPNDTTKEENEKSFSNGKSNEEREEKNSSSNNVCENGEENSDDGQILADALMENFNANLPQYDVDNMVNLMESAEGGLLFDEESKRKVVDSSSSCRQNLQQEKEQEKERSTAIDSEKRDAFNLLAQGKRNMFIKDYESAVSTLGEACQKLNSIYGEFAIELGDAYLTYGNALLEFWRIEEAEKQSANHETNDRKNATNAENEEEMAAEEVSENKKSGRVEGAATAAAKEQEEKEEEEEEEEEEEGKKCYEDDDQDKDETNEETEDGEEEEEEKEEDIENEEDNLQIAWEVIEIAKEIYIRHQNDLNLGKAYTKLGEISIASGNYELAVEDLNKSLEIHEKLERTDNRFVANTYFNLYVAYAALHNYDKSAEHLDKARKVFENLLDELREKLHKLDENELSEIAKVSSEIKDIELILRDMDSKILETTRNKREFMNALFEAIKNKTQEEQASERSTSSTDNLCSTSTNNSSSSSSSLPANNINHLIHKKPKQKSEDSQSDQVKFISKTSKTGENAEKNNFNTNTNGKNTLNGSNDESSQLNMKDKKRRSEDVCIGIPTKKVCFREEDTSPSTL